MRTLLAGMAVIGFLVNPAFSGSRYDRTIDRAAAEIVAGRMGDIRGGFSYDARPVFVTVPDAAATSPTEPPDVAVSTDPWKDGLAPAIERKPSTF
jgi:hypothetical protein